MVDGLDVGEPTSLNDPSRFVGGNTSGAVDVQTDTRRVSSCGDTGDQGGFEVDARRREMRLLRSCRGVVRFPPVKKYYFARPGGAARAFRLGPRRRYPN